MTLNLTILNISGGVLKLDYLFLITVTTSSKFKNFNIYPEDCSFEHAFVSWLQRRIQNPAKHLRWSVLRKKVNYFHKTPHLRYLTRFWIRLCLKSWNLEVVNDQTCKFIVSSEKIPDQSQQQRHWHNLPVTFRSKM